MRHEGENDGNAGHDMMPMGVGGLGGMTVTGDREEADLADANERLKDLPDHENDHLRGTDRSEGAGVLSEGGTAEVTDESPH